MDWHQIISINLFRRQSAVLQLIIFADQIILELLHLEPVCIAIPFLPAVINDWNYLPDEIRNAESLSAFKYRLNLDKPIPNKLFFFGDRKMQVIHTRLRNRCSSLNEHLYLKKIGSITSL